MITFDKYLTFQIADSWYGIDYIRVRMVMESKRLTACDTPQPYVCGAVDFAGRRVPVLDMGRLLLHTKHAEPRPGRVILLVSGADGTVGFLVDQIAGSIRLTPDADAHLSCRNQMQGPVIGSARTPVRTYLLLDIVKLISCSGISRPHNAAGRCRADFYKTN